jgi:hypothetical protein
MTDLPPAAQAIVNAAVEAGGGYGRATPTLHARLAAALRAAADQVAPEVYFAYTGNGDWDHGMEARNDTIREAILAIADELETAK